MPTNTGYGMRTTPTKSAEPHLRAHSKHHKLHDEQDERLIAKIDGPDLQEVRRINHRQR